MITGDFGVLGLPKEYISLQQASKGTPYTADYLRLRARQGKLKSVKIGGSWFTTRVWVDEYYALYGEKVQEILREILQDSRPSVINQNNNFWQLNSTPTAPIINPVATLDERITEFAPKIVKTLPNRVSWYRRFLCIYTDTATILKKQVVATIIKPVEKILWVIKEYCLQIFRILLNTRVWAVARMSAPMLIVVSAVAISTFIVSVVIEPHLSGQLMPYVVKHFIPSPQDQVAVFMIEDTAITAPKQNLPPRVLGFTTIKSIPINKKNTTATVPKKIVTKPVVVKKPVTKIVKTDSKASAAVPPIVCREIDNNKTSTLPPIIAGKNVDTDNQAFLPSPAPNQLSSTLANLTASSINTGSLNVSGTIITNGLGISGSLGANNLSSQYLSVSKDVTLGASSSDKLTINAATTSNAPITIASASSLTNHATTTLNNTFTLGDGGETGLIDTSDWDISATGNMTGVGAITADGKLSITPTIITNNDQGLDISISPSGAVATTYNGVKIALSDSSATNRTATVLSVDATTTNNNDTTYAAIFSGGNVGIGDTTPIATLTVGSGDQFQVNGTTGDVTTAGDININGADIISNTNTLYLKPTPSNGAKAVQIGTGIPSATPTFLLLDSKSVASGNDETGLTPADGAMYYRAFDNKFRCRAGNIWQDCGQGAGGGGWQTITDPIGPLTLNHTGYQTSFTWNSLTNATGFQMSSTSLISGTILSVATSSNTFTGSLLSLSASDVANTGTLLSLNQSSTTNGKGISLTSAGSSNAMEITQTGVGNILQLNDMSGDLTPLIVDQSGNLSIGGNIIVSGTAAGVGTNNPGKALEVNSAGGNNLRLTYNDSNGGASNYTDLTLNSDGALTITGSATTLANSATAEKTFLTLTPGIITLTGSTTVTSLMETSVITGATIAASVGTTVDKATALSVTPPIASNTTLTNSSGIRVLNTTGTAPAEQYGIYIESLTQGTSDYGLAIAGADTAALWLTSASDIITTQAGGIVFGSSKDTNLYRSAANTLKTDDSLVVALDYVTIGGGVGTIYSANNTPLVINSDINVFIGLGSPNNQGGDNNDLFVTDQLEVDGGLYLDNSTFNCTDCINFDDISDSISLDATTTFTLGGSNLVFDTSGVGKVGIGDSNPIEALTLGNGSNITQSGIPTIVSMGAIGGGSLCSAGNDYTYYAEVVGVGLDNNGFEVTTTASVQDSATTDFEGGFCKISVSWNVVPGATSYNVYFRQGSSTSTARFVTTTSTTYSLTDFPIGTKGSPPTTGTLMGTSVRSNENTALLGGNVGIGDASPAALFTVGNGDQFQVSSVGNITTSGTLAVTGNTTLTGDITINGGDLTTSQAIFNLLNATATTVNFAGATTTLNMADAAIVGTIDIGGVTNDGTTTVNIATNGTLSADVITIGNSNASTTVAITGGDDWNIANTGILTLSASAAQNTALVITDTDYTNALNIGDNNIIGTTASIGLTNFSITGATGDIITAGDIAINGGDLATSQAIFNLLNVTATTINFAGAATTLNMADAAIVGTIDIGGVTNNGTTTVNIATHNTAADVITIGNSNASTTVAITGGDDWNIANTGILTLSASAAQNTALVITDTDYTNALNIGDNNIIGTTASIDLTNFDVTGATGDIITAGDITINGGDLTTSQAIFNLLNATATTVNFAGATTTLNMAGGSGSTGCTIDLNGSLACAGTFTFSSSSTATLASTTLSLTAAAPVINSTSGLSINTTNNQNVTFGSGTITIPNLTVSTGVTITGVSGLISSGVTSDIVTGNNEHLALMPNGTGNVGIGVITPSEKLAVKQNTALSDILGLYTSGNVNVLQVSDGGVIKVKSINQIGSSTDHINVPLIKAYFVNACHGISSTYTEYTIEANSANGTPFKILETVNDCFYIGASEPFKYITFDLQQFTTNNFVSYVQYCSGSNCSIDAMHADWKGVVLTQDETGGAINAVDKSKVTGTFKNDGTVTYTITNNDWVTTTLEGDPTNGTKLYWIRWHTRSGDGYTSTAPTQDPYAYQIQLAKDANRFQVDPSADATDNPTFFIDANGLTNVYFNGNIPGGTENKVCHTGADIDSTTAETRILVACGAANADLAEEYGTTDSSLEPGDVVAVESGVNTNNKAWVKKTTTTYQFDSIGVVSTDPYDTFGRVFQPEDNPRPIALSGRVPVKVSLENGPIQVGDHLTSSSTPGVAMKATQAGASIGIALESYQELGTNGPDKIMMFVSLGYYAPPTDTLTITNPPTTSSSDNTMNPSSTFNSNTIIASSITLNPTNNQTIISSIIPTTFVGSIISILTTNNRPLLTLDNNGRLTTQTLATTAITLDATDPDKATVGSAQIAVGNKEVVIKSPMVHKASKIFILTPENPEPLAVTSIMDGEFTVGRQSPSSESISFDWLIVEVANPKYKVQVDKVSEL